jgi:hypothetical protein
MSGLWWALAVAVLASAVAVVTLTLGRGVQPAAVPSTTVGAATSERRQWTSV